MIENHLSRVFGREIGNSTLNFHALPVVLQAGTPDLDKSSSIGDIITTLLSVPGFNLIITQEVDILLMMLDPQSQLCRRGGISLGIFSIPFVPHSYLGAGHSIIFNVGADYVTAYLIFSLPFQSSTRDYAISFRNKSSYRIFILITVLFPSIHLTSGAVPPFLVTTVPGSLQFLLKVGVWIGMSSMIPPCVSCLLPLMCLLRNKSGHASSVPKKAGVGVVLSSKHT